MSGPADPITERYEALVQRILRFIDAHQGLESDETAFTSLALEVFRWQYERIVPYRHLCDTRKLTPTNVTDWREIPAIPTEAHKDQLIFAWRPDEAVRVFRTSGTTQEMRGSHFFHTLRLMNATGWQSFHTMMLPDGLRECTCVFLMQAPPSVPDSSLSHMLGLVVDQLDASQRPYCLTGDGLEHARIHGLLSASIARQRPVLLATTAFALARWLEESDESYRLPPGSRVMETGGFKGHTTQYDRASLYEAIPERLGVPESHIVSEYGMTELSSQCYTGTLRIALGHETPGEAFSPPPWMRVRIIDPETGADLPVGDPGLIQFLDLANLDAVASIYTADLGRMREEGTFELMGRMAGAGARGCSLAAAEILGEADGEGEEW